MNTHAHTHNRTSKSPILLPRAAPEATASPVGENETQNTAAVQQQGLQPASASLSSQNSAAAVAMAGAMDAAADQVTDTSVSESEAPQLVSMESMSGLTQWEPDNETFIDWEIGGKAGACAGCVCLSVCLFVCLSVGL
jgi:hypothetical protein